MSTQPSVCLEIETALLAVGLDEADPDAVTRVAAHVPHCSKCRRHLKEYRALNAIIDVISGDPRPSLGVTTAHLALDERLADLRRRLVSYGVFRSPLGPILIAYSENGVVLIEYLTKAGFKASHLSRMSDIETTDHKRQIEPLYAQLLAYLQGRSMTIDWPLDLTFAYSDFQRSVLQIAAGLPHGSITSYAAIAERVGGVTAARAVAKALRWNPLPIAIPCHRVVSALGGLGGYVGDKVALKKRLLSAEGVPVSKTSGELRIVREVMYVRPPEDPAYCLPTCRSLAGLRPGRSMLFASRESAEAAGLRPCTTCRPHLHRDLR